MSTLGVWIVLMMLLLLRGLLGAMEASLHGVSDARVRELAKSGSWPAARVSRLKVDPEVSAAALRSGMVLSGFMAAAMGVLVPPRMLNESLAKVLETSWAWVTPLTSALIVALAASMLDVAFRSAASQRPEATALALSRLGSMTVRVLGPFVRGLVAPLNLVLRALRGPGVAPGAAATAGGAGEAAHPPGAEDTRSTRARRSSSGASSSCRTRRAAT